MRSPFVVNVTDAPAYRHPSFGSVVVFEPDDQPFPEVGINIRVLQPGESNAAYHSENQQEDFLVLGGRCTLILDGAERELSAWDFVHCPAGARHAFVGAGDGPCWILMIGARGRDEQLDYPVDATAAKHGVSVTTPTRDPDVAYADRPGAWEPTQPPWPPT
jgi:uncharacterized cupin superfamily protein